MTFAPAVTLDIARGLDAIMLPVDSELAIRSGRARQGLIGYFRELTAARRAQAAQRPPLGPHRRRGSG